MPPLHVEVFGRRADGSEVCFGNRLDVDLAPGPTDDAGEWQTCNIDEADVAVSWPRGRWTPAQVRAICKTHARLLAECLVACAKAGAVEGMGVDIK